MELPATGASGPDGNTAVTTQQLVTLLYRELRAVAAAKIAQEQIDQTLSATGLVHEAYVRLAQGGGEQAWDGHGHFFAAATEAMRRILINRARDKHRFKRGGQFRRVALEDAPLAMSTPAADLLAIDEAIEGLAAEDPEAAQVVKLRFFAGLTFPETAAALGISIRSAKRRWERARERLAVALGTAAEPLDRLGERRVPEPIQGA